MCGHDHCEEYIDEGKGPVYVLSGSGFECCYASTAVDKNPRGSIKVGKAAQSVARLSLLLTPLALCVQFAYFDGPCPTDHSPGAVCPPVVPGNFANASSSNVRLPNARLFRV